jgi:hypothetical protein
MSPLVNHLLNQRKRAIQNGNTEANTRLQEKINKFIRENQLSAVKQKFCNQKTGSKSWWSNVNGITSRKKKQDISVSASLNHREIEKYFQTVNTDPNYTTPELLQISEGTRIPSLSNHEVQRILLNQKRSSSGPHNLPYWFWKSFAIELAPIVTEIFNMSIKNSKVPQKLKSANLLPLPKESPLNSCNQLRPISLTDIMRLFEKCVYKSEIAPITRNKIGPGQFAYKKGHNLTMALIKSQHQWLEWLDKNANYVRVLSFDFSKAFDSVPHELLFEKVEELPIKPYVVNWIISFQENRIQRVMVDGIVTEYLYINRDVPQGTVLGTVLFSIMVDDIKIADPNNALVKIY